MYGERDSNSQNSASKTDAYAVPPSPYLSICCPDRDYFDKLTINFSPYLINYCCPDRDRTYNFRLKI